MLSQLKTDPIKPLGLRDLHKDVVLVLHPQRNHLAVLSATEGEDGWKLSESYPVPEVEGITRITCGNEIFRVPDALVDTFIRVRARGKAFYQAFDNGDQETNSYRLVITDTRFRNLYQRRIESLAVECPHKPQQIPVLALDDK